MSNDNIAQFPEPLIFICSCGCQSFRIQSNSTVECVNCHNCVNEIEEKPIGEWVKILPPVPPIEDVTRDDGGTIVSTSFGVVGIARARAMKMINEWDKTGALAIVSAYAKDGTGKHWAYIETQDQKEWVIEKLSDLIDHIKQTSIK